MNPAENINNKQLKEYLLSRGWSLSKKGLEKGIYLFDHPSFSKRQIMFAIEEDYDDAVEHKSFLIDKLSDFYQESPSVIIEEIQETGNETFSLRYHSAKFDIRDMALSDSEKILQGIRKMIASAASSVLAPQPYHPKLNRKEVVHLVKACRFRHTQEGSFIYKVSCPVNFGISQLSFQEKDNFPLERRTFINIAEASNELLSVIELGTEEELIRRIQNKECSSISYNFCEGLTDILNTDDPLKLDLGIRWAYSKNNPPPKGVKNLFRFSYDMIHRIENIKSSLKPSNDNREGDFIGTVEALNGNLGPDQQRSGPVTLVLLIDHKTFKVTVDLNSEQYKVAHNAHMPPNPYIRIKGILKQTGNQTYTISPIEEFELNKN